MTEGMNADQLHRYVSTRRRIDPEIRLIHSLTSVLAQFENTEPYGVAIDPAALGIVHATLEESVLRVWEALDDFMPLARARRELEEG